MIFYFLQSKKINNSNFSQLLFDYMFNDFENNLREMGFGDIAVNKKMKAFIRAFMEDYLNTVRVLIMRKIQVIKHCSSKQYSIIYLRGII